MVGESQFQAFGMRSGSDLIGLKFVKQFHFNVSKPKCFMSNTQIIFHLVLSNKKKFISNILDIAFMYFHNFLALIFTFKKMV